MLEPISKEMPSEEIPSEEKSESFRYLLLLRLILLMTIMFALASDVGREGEHFSLRDLPYYHELKDNGEDFLRTTLGLSHHLVTTEDVLSHHEWLAPIYHERIDYWMNYFKLDPFFKKGIEDAIYREAFDSGDLPLRISPWFESETKSKINNLIQQDSPRASFGVGNIKAYRFGKEKYDLFPTEVKEQLLFDDERGFIDPKSLSEYLNTGTQEEKFDKMVMFYTATLAVDQDEIIAKAKEQNISVQELAHISAVIACCSYSPDGADLMEGDYGYKLLTSPEDRELYFSDPETRFYHYDKRGKNDMTLTSAQYREKYPDIVSAYERLFGVDLLKNHFDAARQALEGSFVGK